MSYQETPKTRDTHMKEDDNLWPAEIHQIEVRSPFSIIKQQASKLGERTKNIVIAAVAPVANLENGRLVYSFSLVAPALANYSLRLFTFEHALTSLYPVRIVSHYLNDSSDIRWADGLSIENENALMVVLKEIFNHPKTMIAIQAMLAQSEGYTIEDVHHAAV